MSVKLMSAIFETEMRDLPYTKDGEDRMAKASTAKLVLLALADYSNDYGESIYPGYGKMEIRTALSRQGLADTYEALKQNGILEIEVRGSRLKTNNYTINIRSFPPMFKEAETLPEVVKPLDSGLSSHLTQPSQATRLNPSINHQLTINETSSLSDKELSEANQMVDAIIASSNGEHWQGRETFRPDHYPLVDWYHKATGQDCPRSKRKDWHKALLMWSANNLTVADLQAAYDMDIKWRGVFTSPNQLTDKAIALRAQKQTQPEPTHHAPIPERIRTPRPAHVPPPRIGGNHD